MTPEREALFRRFVRPPFHVSQRHQDMACESMMFAKWFDSIDSAFRLKHIDITTVDFRNEPSVENVLFIRLLVWTEGAEFPQVVELRAETAVVFVEIKCEGERYALLIEQPRLATGQQRFPEVPAGMMTGFRVKVKAAPELKEWLGLDLEHVEMEDLTERLPGPADPRLYFSPGLLNERARFFLVKIEKRRSELDALRSRAAVIPYESAAIVPVVIPFHQLPARVRDLKSLVAYWLCLEPTTASADHPRLR